MYTKTIAVLLIGIALLCSTGAVSAYEYTDLYREDPYTELVDVLEVRAPGFSTFETQITEVYVPGFTVPDASESVIDKQQAYEYGTIVPGFYTPAIYTPETNGNEPGLDTSEMEEMGFFTPGFYTEGVYLSDMVTPGGSSGIMIPGYFTPGFYTPGTFEDICATVCFLTHAR